MVREVPNLLTIMRLLAVPVMVACLVEDAGSEGGWRWAAWLLFVLAAATDALDGYLARRWGVVSAFGKLADPLADKALVLSALAFLAVNGETAWWPLIVVAIREVGVTLGRLAVAKDVVIPASMGGKVKTALQVAALFFLLVPTHVEWVDGLGWWLLVASVVIAVVTGLDYGRRIGGVVHQHRIDVNAARDAAERVDVERDGAPDPSGHVG